MIESVRKHRKSFKTRDGASPELALGVTGMARREEPRPDSVKSERGHLVNLDKAHQVDRSQPPVKERAEGLHDSARKLLLGEKENNGDD